VREVGPQIRVNITGCQSLFFWNITHPFPFYFLEDLTLISSFLKVMKDTSNVSIFSFGDWSWSDEK